MGYYSLCARCPGAVRAALSSVWTVTSSTRASAASVWDVVSSTQATTASMWDVASYARAVAGTAHAVMVGMWAAEALK